jgi:hypothetical protein
VLRGTFRGDQEEFQVNNITDRLHVQIGDWKRKKLQNNYSKDWPREGLFLGSLVNLSVLTT